MENKQPARTSFRKQAFIDNLDMPTNEFGHITLGDKAYMHEESMPQPTIDQSGNLVAQTPSIIDSPSMAKIAAAIGIELEGHEIEEAFEEPPLFIDEPIKFEIPSNDETANLSFAEMSDPLLLSRMRHQSSPPPTQAQAPRPLKTPGISSTVVASVSNSAEFKCIANCGAKLPAGAKYCVNCGHPQHAKHCINCGYQYLAREKFCPECGTNR